MDKTINTILFPLRTITFLYSFDIKSIIYKSEMYVYIVSTVVKKHAVRI